MCEEASHPKEGKVCISRDPCSSLGGRQRQEEGESIFHFGPKTIVQLFEKSLVFFHPDLSSIGGHHIRVSLALNIRVFGGIMYSWVYVWMPEECCPVLLYKDVGCSGDQITASNLSKGAYSSKET